MKKHEFSPYDTAKSPGGGGVGGVVKRLIPWDYGSDYGILELSSPRDVAG